MKLAEFKKLVNSIPEGYDNHEVETEWCDCCGDVCFIESRGWDNYGRWPIIYIRRSTYAKEDEIGKFIK